MAFGLPLIAAAGLLFNIQGNLSNQSVEQVKLDAAVLSVCHQQANLLNDVVPTFNISIRLVQAAMAANAASCIKPPFADCIPRHKQLSRIGSWIENTQNSLITSRYLGRNQILEEMRKLNELDAKFLQDQQILASIVKRVESVSSGFQILSTPKGFKREKNMIQVPGRLKSWKIPKVLAANESQESNGLSVFEKEHLYEKAYSPSRKIFSLKENAHSLRAQMKTIDTKLKIQNIFHNPLTPESQARSYSSCTLITDASPYKFKVKRLASKAEKIRQFQDQLKHYQQKLKSYAIKTPTRAPANIRKTIGELLK